MALPKVSILFENGALAGVTPSADGVVGLVVAGVAKVATDTKKAFELNKAYLLRRLSDLTDMDVTSAVNDDNAQAYRHVKAFFDEAGDGAELWLMALASEASQHKMVDMTEAFSAKDLLVAASGRIRVLGVARGGAKVSGIDTSMLNAEKLAEWATSSMYAPAVVLLEALHWSGSAMALTDFTVTSYNRVGVLLGDTLSHAGTGDAAIGLLLGRIARIPVQRHIGSVADGPVSAVNAYIGSVEASKADAETIHAKGYISFRTFVGKAGYFFSDDSLATSYSDDYRSLARRRTVDKAFRIAYVTLLQFLNSEMPVTDDGKLVPGTVKSWQNEVERAIMLEMGNAGNLGRNPLDPNDTGVRCLIDPDQNIVSDSRVEVSLQVKPYGYAKYIDVKLGFMTSLA